MSIMGTESKRPSRTPIEYWPCPFISSMKLKTFFLDLEGQRTRGPALEATTKSMSLLRRESLMISTTISLGLFSKEWCCHFFQTAFLSSAEQTPLLGTGLGGSGSAAEDMEGFYRESCSTTALWSLLEEAATLCRMSPDAGHMRPVSLPERI